MKPKRWVIVLCCCMLLMCLASCDGTSLNKQEEIKITYTSMMGDLKKKAKGSTLVCWYQNEEDGAWLHDAAAAFHEKYGYQVEVVYYDGINYLEDLNHANAMKAGPDVFIMSNENLLKGTMAGLIQENLCYDESFWNDYYPQTAQVAATVKNKSYGYPVYFDTYFLIYDANLISEPPATFEDIQIFLDDYEDIGNEKAIFRFDVSDPYIDTMFMGAYADLFGENGDDDTSFSVNHRTVIRAMEYYQTVSDYFSIDIQTISYEKIKKNIRDGALIFGICKGDIVKVMNQDAQHTNYKLALLPDLNEKIESRGLSVTHSAYVNEYANHSEIANMFGIYLSYEYCENQFQANGKFAVRKNVDVMRENENLQAIYQQYENSLAIPKALEIGDFWNYSEMAYRNIWMGKDVKEEMDALQEKMEERLK